MSTACPIDAFLERLENVKVNSTGYTAKCPSHDDIRNSLSVSESDAGKVIVHCHAGCTVKEILGALDMTMADLFPTRPPRGHTQPVEKAKVVGTYAYTDEDGATLYEVVRMQPKDFRQRRPDGKGGSIWKLDSVQRVPYRLPELLASDSSEIVYIVEGEKDADLLASHGLVATTNAGGAGKWRAEYNEHLKGRKVVILPDNDKAGHDHASAVAESLSGVALTLKVLDLPGLPTKGDVSDWFDRDGTRERLSDLVAALPEHEGREDAGRDDDAGRTDRQPTPDDDRAGRGRPAQATLLVESMGDCTLFHDAEGEPFVVLPVGGHDETHPLHSKAVRRFMARRYFAAFGNAPNAQATQDALGILAGKAIFAGDECPVFIRLAGHDGMIYLDLADKEWRVVAIDATGWRVIEAGKCPVRFRRAKGMLPLPVPMKGGNLAALRPYVNLRDDAGWILLVGYLVNCLRPHGPFWILAVTGEQGSAKSTLLRLLRALVDPNVAPIRSFPREERDVVIAANNGWLPCFDNASSIPVWMSDALCRLATGGGFATRTLYENDEETIFTATRPLALNGIEDVVTRGDLADRAIALALATIPEEGRKTEAELWGAFERDRPWILGALLDAVAGAIKHLPTTRLDKLPRMADAALWVAAAEPALDWKQGTFMSAYTANRAEAGVLVLEDSPLAGAVLALMEGRAEPWTGAATELLDLLNNGRAEAQQKAEGWPRKPNSLSGMLRRLAPNLRAAGLNVMFERDGHKRQRSIHLEQLGKSLSASSASSARGGSPYLDAECGAEDADDHGSADDHADDLRDTLSSGKGSRNSTGNRAVRAIADDADDDLLDCSHDGGTDTKAR